MTRAASAWRYCARPISCPSGVTAALLLMFCALNGATWMWRFAKKRHKAVTRKDFPASLVQPRIMIGVAIRIFLSALPVGQRPSLRDQGVCGGGLPAVR